MTRSSPSPPCLDGGEGRGEEDLISPSFFLNQHPKGVLALFLPQPAPTRCPRFAVFGGIKTGRNLSPGLPQSVRFRHAFSKPGGRLKVAPRFIAGLEHQRISSPVGDGRNHRVGRTPPRLRPVAGGNPCCVPSFPRGIAPVEPSEAASRKHRHGQRTQSGRENLEGIVQIKITDLAEKPVAGRDIKSAPKHVHGGGGQPHPWRPGKWTLKRPPHHSADEMWNRVGQKNAAEKIRDTVMPVHILESPPGLF